MGVASDKEREKSDKFCSEALISAWGSFTCRKSTTRDPRLYFPSKGSHTQDFYALKKIHRPRPGSNQRTSNIIFSTIFKVIELSWIYVYKVYPTTSISLLSRKLYDTGCSRKKKSEPIPTQRIEWWYFHFQEEATSRNIRSQLLKV